MGKERESPSPHYHRERYDPKSHPSVSTLDASLATALSWIHNGYIGIQLYNLKISQLHLGYSSILNASPGTVDITVFPLPGTLKYVSTRNTAPGTMGYRSLLHISRDMHRILLYFEYTPGYIGVRISFEYSSRYTEYKSTEADLLVIVWV